MDTTKLEQLLIKAKELQKNAYAPYSKFRVSAIVGLRNNQEVMGVNVENAASPVTLCAERTALAQVYTLGYKKEDIAFLFLITDSAGLGSPCGACRQFMIETMPLDAKVFISNFKTNDVKNIKIVSVKELLPFAFMPELLKGNN